MTWTFDMLFITLTILVWCVSMLTFAAEADGNAISLQVLCQIPDSPVLLQITLRRTWRSAPDFMAIHPVIVQKFQPGQKKRLPCLAMPKKCHQRKTHKTTGKRRDSTTHSDELLQFRSAAPNTNKTRKTKWGIWGLPLHEKEENNRFFFLRFYWCSNHLWYKWI